MKMLVACEQSGEVRSAFEALGWDAWSCDLLPTEKPGNHHQGCVLGILDLGWDLVIGHPVCKYLTNSGVRWLHTDPTRYAKMEDGVKFFNAILHCGAKHVAVENPVMHGYAKRLIGVNQAQTIQPYHFGHLEQKATCLWLKNLPKLRHTTDLKAATYKLPAKIRQRGHYLPPSPTRERERSRTLTGIANAMAIQWTQHLYPDSPHLSLL